MFVRAGLILVGVFYLINGAAMIAVPAYWYAATPGVVATGPMNPHFIRDIGLIFVASGAGFLLGARSGSTAAALALAAATWPALHALFHVWLWFAYGFPQAADVAVTEALGVVGLAAVGAWLAWLRAKREGVVR